MKRPCQQDVTLSVAARGKRERVPQIERGTRRASEGGVTRSRSRAGPTRCSPGTRLLDLDARRHWGSLKRSGKDVRLRLYTRSDGATGGDGGRRTNPVTAQHSPARASTGGATGTACAGSRDRRKGVEAAAAVQWRCRTVLMLALRTVKRAVQELAERFQTRSVRGAEHETRRVTRSATVRALTFRTMLSHVPPHQP